MAWILRKEGCAMSDNKEAFTCALCDEAIYVGEDYYDIPNLGKCCTSCINDCKCYEAEDESYNAYVDAKIDEMREERAGI
jgi:hypothetical protein